MFVSEFFDFFSTITLSNRVGLEDFSDRLHLVTVVLFSISATVVGFKQFVFNPVSCYIATGPSGEDFSEYVQSYCWVHGTIPLKFNELLPDTEREWELYDQVRRVTYYQWVPFVLGLQCILFYLPHIIWQAVCTSQAGGDVFQLVKAAAEAATSQRGDREKSVKRVAEFLTDVIIGGRGGYLHSGRRSVASRLYSACDVCWATKRSGTTLIILYLVFKLIMLVNAILQLVLIQRFLGFHSEGSSSQRSLTLANVENPQGETTIIDADEDFSGLGFGLTVANHLRSGRDWPETTLFPRVAYCRVRGIRLVGVENAYTAQCALPVNMLNEKIYIFFWFWIIFVITASAASLVLWFIRVVFTPRRKHFVKRFLRIKLAMIKTKPYGINRADVDEFVDDYLRRDGVFLIRMLALNAGEVITAEIVTELYNTYLDQRSTTNNSPDVSITAPQAKLQMV